MRVEPRRTNQRPQYSTKAKSSRLERLPQHANLAMQIAKSLRTANTLCLWLDDLEREGRTTVREHFSYYRDLIDAALDSEAYRKRCGVFFFVNMLEAYFLADTAAVNAELRLELSDHAGDCENVRKPTNVLDEAVRARNKSGSYDKKQSGERIAWKLDIDHVLSQPRTCSALRTLVAWCRGRLGLVPDTRFCLQDGDYWRITSTQLDPRPDSTRIRDLAVEESYRSD